MTRQDDEAGVIAVLLERLAKQRLPRALALKERVDQGQRLNEMELLDLEEILGDAQQVMPMVDRHPEYKELVGKLAGLYEEITAQALKNEQS